MKKQYVLQLLLFLAMLAGLVACGGGSDDDARTGTVQMALTDAVDHDFAAVVISIKEIRAVPADKDGMGMAMESLPLIVSFPEPLVVNVLDLAYTQQLLGEAVLPAGRYNQLRLVLTENIDPLAPANYITLAADPQTRIPVDTPSGQQSGLKIIGGFDVVADRTSAVVLDFDPARVIETGMDGKWIFKPTAIRVLQSDDVLASYGAITGQTVQAGTTPTPVTAATVYAYPQDAIAPVAAMTVNAEDGSFRLLLPPGEYLLKIVAAGFLPYTSPAALVVIAEQDLAAGAIVLQPVATTQPVLQ